MSTAGDARKRGSARVVDRIRPVSDDVHEYRGVLILPKNVHGMYSARVDVPGGGVRVAADTLDGIKALIREELGGN